MKATLKAKEALSSEHLYFTKNQRKGNPWCRETEVTIKDTIFLGGRGVATIKQCVYPCVYKVCRKMADNNTQYFDRELCGSRHSDFDNFPILDINHRCETMKLQTRKDSTPKPKVNKNNG